MGQRRGTEAQRHGEGVRLDARVRDDNPRPGTILVKALEPLNRGTDVIRVLVTLH